MGVALASRTPALRGAGALVYPILALGGLQLAANVLSGFTPMTLFVSLATNGVALVLAPGIRTS